MQSLLLFKCHQNRIYSTVRLNSTSSNESLFTRIRYVLNHYWLGSKLLYKNSQIVRQLTKKDSQQLTRLDNFLLKQFRYDIKIGVPFVTLFALPIVGYLAPILALLAPKYLPSTLIMPKQKSLFLDQDAKASASTIDSLKQFSQQIFNVEQIQGMIPSMQFIDDISSRNQRFELILSSIPEYSILFEKAFDLSLLPREHLLLLHQSVLHSSFLAKYCLNTYSLEKQLDHWEYQILQDDRLITNVDQLDRFDLVKSLYDRGLYLHTKQMGQVLQFQQTQNLNQTDKKLAKSDQQLTIDERIINDWRLLLKQWIKIHLKLAKTNAASPSFLLHLSSLLLQK